MPLAQVPGQQFDALVGRVDRRGHLCARGPPPIPAVVNVAEFRSAARKPVWLHFQADHWRLLLQGARKARGGAPLYPCRSIKNNKGVTS